MVIQVQKELVVQEDLLELEIPEILEGVVEEAVGVPPNYLLSQLVEVQGIQGILEEVLVELAHLQEPAVEVLGALVLMDLRELLIQEEQDHLEILELLEILEHLLLL